jgi:ABC-type polysaccharide/polyol phosphate export permease
MSSISPYPDGVSDGGPGGEGFPAGGGSPHGAAGPAPHGVPGSPAAGGYGAPAPSPGTFGTVPQSGSSAYQSPGQPMGGGVSQPIAYGSDNPPPRDLPQAGMSPFRRNMDDTAELPAFLDSALSDESPRPQGQSPAVKPNTRKFPLTTGFTALLRHRHALSVLVRRDLAVKYQSTAMGYLWSLIEPLGLALIYWLIFGVVFGRTGDIPDGAGYALYIIAGVFAWQWFSQAMNEGTKSLGGQSSLITVMKVPREVFPVSKVFARFAEYVIGFPILIAVAVFFGGTFGWNIFWLIPAILIQAILLTGIVFMLSAANVLFKDVQRFLSLFMRVLFYGSAIIYPLSRVEEALKHHEVEWAYTLFTYSPLVVLFQMYRAVWIPSLAPNWYQIGVAFAFATVLMFFGRWIFYRLEPRVLKAL